MNTTIGIAQHAISCTTSATVSLQRLYVSRFVSPPLSGVSSITAQTWTYNFAAQEGSTNANWPVNGASQVVRVMCYVWRPSSQTKVGNILDGNSAATLTEAAAERSYTTTFSGSLVSSVSDGDVICFEVWFEITQATAAIAINGFMYDGNTVQLTGGIGVTNHASFIETPQNLTFGTEVINSRLYFHAATSSLTNLPTAEQGSLTADVLVDATTVNRNMNTTIGTSQTSLAAITLAQTAKQELYFTRFVSDALSGVSSIPAGNWIYNFAAAESNTSANFPCGVGGTVRCTCYVWRPSSQTKLGTILDGTTLGGVEGAASTEVAEHLDFAGSSVASITNGDVIIFEVWNEPSQAAATSYTDTFYYDGTTVTQMLYVTTTTVSNHASFIECSGPFTFSAPSAGAVDCTVTGKTIYNKTTTHG